MASLKAVCVPYWLIYFIDEILEMFDKGEQIDAVYTDFQKVFDKVDHQIIIEKLGSFVFSKHLIQLFRLYLRERKQVMFRGATSKLIRCTSGIPQRSNLSPLLFSASTSMISLTKSKILKYLLYAYDLKMLREIQNENDVKLIQLCIKALKDGFVMRHSKIFTNTNVYKDHLFYSFGSLLSQVKAPVVWNRPIWKNTRILKSISIIRTFIIFPTT